MGLLALTYVGRRRILAQDRIDHASLAEITWAIPESALADRTRLGIELLSGGLRFVEPSEHGDVLQLPSTTPMLVEAAWVGAGESHTTLLEASPGKQYDLWSDANQVLIRTLAGEEYSYEMLDSDEQAQADAKKIPLLLRYHGVWAKDRLRHQPSARSRQELHEYHKARRHRRRLRMRQSRRNSAFGCHRRAPV